MQAERKRLGLTVEDVAKEIHVHPNAVSRWEQGKAEPMSNNLIALAKLYQVSPDYLLDQTDDPVTV